MEPAAAAELKTLLTGIALPAKQPELLAYAVQQHAGPPLLDALRTLSSEQEYESLDDVVEELLQVQPPDPPPTQAEPHEESGLPPGGDDYTNREPQSGEVRDSA